MERAEALRRRCRQDPEDVLARARLAAELHRSGLLTRESLEAAAFELDPAAIAVVGPWPEREEFERIWERSNRFHLRLRWLMLASAPVLALGSCLLARTRFGCPATLAIFVAMILYGSFANRPRRCPRCGERELRKFEVAFSNPAPGVCPGASVPFDCRSCGAHFSRCGGRWFAWPLDEHLEAYEAAVGEIS